MFRAEKLNNLIKIQLNKIIFKELDILPGIILTITRVECTPTGTSAKVYVSVVPDNQFEDVFEFLKRHTREIQYFLKKSLRINPIPKIFFVEEKATREAANIEKLLGMIKKKKKGAGKE